jgi:hypothetical protein
VTVALAVFGVTVSMAFAQDSVILGTDADETVTGTPANDTIYGRAGNDLLVGLGGDDTLDGGPGADLLSGGPGSDAVSYATGAPVIVTLDGQANDGVPGEGDNVGRDVEEIFGSAGGDILAGNDAANTIDGDAGDDQIAGGRGPDGLFGGDGNDRIFSRDGSADRVDCGSGLIDVAIVDSRDIVRNCEQAGGEAVTERFLVSDVLGIRRVRSMRLFNITNGSRVVIACISRCRPRSPRTRAILRRGPLKTRGGTGVVRIRLKPSPAVVAGSTFEIGVKAPRARPRCTRFRLRARNGQITSLQRLATRCRSVARTG